jgi:hypothetical protein
MAEKSARNAQTAGVKAYHRKVDSQVESIFERYPEATDNASDFIRIYESEYGKFPFWYARANTEFGEQFGRKLSPEDAAWGRFRPATDLSDLESQMKAMDTAEKLRERYEAKSSKAGR